MKRFRANANAVKQLGRTYYSEEDILWCALSGSGIEYKFSGNKCTINIVGDSVSTREDVDNHARIGIYVNNQRVVDDMISKKDKEYVVIDEGEVIEATIKILKLSETAMSTFGIASIDVEGGTIEPTEKKNLLIEFVGDSITCGYGVDDEDPEHNFSTKTEDVTRAYAYKTAEALDADYSMVSISGYGIISGYTTGEEPITNQLIPQYYEKLGFSYGDFGAEKPQDIPWDFSLRQPDIVVINLGTNDSSYTKDHEDRIASFSQEYGVFIKRIRELNPEAAIICSLGIMGTQLYPSIELAVNTYMVETADVNIHLLRFDEQRHEDGFVADWHPTEITHIKAAKKLVDKILYIQRKLDPSKPAIALKDELNFFK
ncbi:MAG TPA: SGNH/GDSL hydrolase family protein [Clostridiales bacterium]|nr:SGNH/GDSL hydrolase family protein [Clostridiales bacterium]